MSRTGCLCRPLRLTKLAPSPVGRCSGTLCQMSGRAAEARGPSRPHATRFQSSSWLGCPHLPMSPFPCSASPVPRTSSAHLASLTFQTHEDLDTPWIPLPLGSLPLPSVSVRQPSLCSQGPQGQPCTITYHTGLAFPVDSSLFSNRQLWG